MRLVITFLIFFLSAMVFSQTIPDSTTYLQPPITINKCTPKDHLKCVILTTSEVYQDGRNGKGSRHWWTMSYIGRACTEQHGKGFGKIFETMFVLPHYTLMALVNGIGLVASVIKPQKEKNSKNEEEKSSL